MQVNELENLTEAQLREHADQAFAKAEEKGPGYFAEAQFYMQELEHRFNTRISTRDYVLELVIIVLILLEIIVGIYEGNAQMKLTEAQTKVLHNLQLSTEHTAAAIAEELALQYKVSVNLQPNSYELQIFNNSKNEITVYAVKVGSQPTKAIPVGGLRIPGGGSTSVLISKLYPAFFRSLSRTNARMPLTVYLKAADLREYVAQSTFDFSEQGFKVIRGVETVSQLSQWSKTITPSPTP